MNTLDRSSALLVRAAGRLCAVPIAHVVEVMRELPLEHVVGAPGFVRGLSIIRGAPMPVVDLGLLTGGRREAIGRLVAIRLGERRAALAVDAVLGVRTLDDGLLEGLPPLLRDAGADLVDAIGVLDAELLVTLHTGRLIPDELWQTLGVPGVSP